MSVVSAKTRNLGENVRCIELHETVKSPDLFGSTGCRP